MSSSSSNSLLLSLKSYLSTSEHSDLTITCEGKEFKVHKIILGGSSPVFNKMLSGEYKEAREKHDIIPLMDDAEALQALIHYLYNFVYCDSFLQNNSSMTFAIRVYAIADKYQVPSLKTLAAQRFKDVCKPIDDIDDFITAITLIEEHTSPHDRLLWRIVLPAIKRNIAYLLKSEAFQELIFDMKDLNLKLLSLLNQPNEMKNDSLQFDSAKRDDANDEDGGNGHRATHIPFSTPDLFGGGRRLGR